MNKPQITSSEISPESANLLKSFSTEELEAELKRRKQAGYTGELTSKIGAGVVDILQDGDKDTSSDLTKQTKTPNQVELSPEEQRFTQEITRYLEYFAGDRDLSQTFSNYEGDKKYIKKSDNYFSYGHFETEEDEDEDSPYRYRVYDANEYRIYIDKEGKVCYDSGDFHKGTEKKGNPYDASIQKIRTDIMKPAIDMYLRNKARY